MSKQRRTFRMLLYMTNNVMVFAIATQPFAVDWYLIEDEKKNTAFWQYKYVVWHISRKCKAKNELAFRSLPNFKLYFNSLPLELWSRELISRGQFPNIPQYQNLILGTKKGVCTDFTLSYSLIMPLIISLPMK